MKKGKIPHTYVIVFGIVVLAAVFTWFIPGGQFDRKRVSIGEGTREVIMSDSFRYVKILRKHGRFFLHYLTVLKTRRILLSLS